MLSVLALASAQTLLGETSCCTSVACSLVCYAAPLIFGLRATEAQEQPNILIIWGDDIGTWNISHNNRGMMGYKTPNIDRIAREGLSFTDYYGQQSCTAGRAAFLNGSVPVRTGMTKVGMPHAPQGWQMGDVTFATVLKAQGYSTGQFGKNHQGDLDEHLPTMHGFDEFMGNLYHLNAEEEPENRDYPGDMVLANGKTFTEEFGPRGVIKSKALPGGKQEIEDTGALTKKRMETIDEETLAAATDFIKRKNKSGKPWMCWWNATRMHFRTHVKEEHKNLAGPNSDEYHDGMVEHDMQVGELLKLVDELNVSENTIVLYSTDNGPHYNTWPDAGTTPFRSEKNSSWKAFRVPAFVRLARQVPRRGNPQQDRRSRRLAADLRCCRRCSGHQRSTQGWRRVERSQVQELHRRLQHAGLLLEGGYVQDHHRRSAGVASQGVHLRHGWRRGGCDPRGRLEGDVSGEPGTSAADLARAIHQAADAVAVQPSSRSVREVTAQLEHLSRLDDRPRVCARTDAGRRQSFPHDPERLPAQPNPRRLESLIT
ncbi:MAG: sulfatase-like hydrolase/transferase [Planctomycetaceae bacterium]